MFSHHKLKVFLIPLGLTAAALAYAAIQMKMYRSSMATSIFSNN